MQKNCTEFIAYENVVPDRAVAPAAPDKARGRRRRGGSGMQSIEQAVPLVKRALKVLTDREVTPQLGLLKSTLLQLDSSFSERDYGVSTFRDFAEKLAEKGSCAEAPGPQHAGRAERSGDRDRRSDEPATPSLSAPSRPTAEPREAGARPRASCSSSRTPVRSRSRDELEPAAPDAALGDGVALVRALLADPTTPPRWPMYPRQFKQFLRTASPTSTSAATARLPT